MQRIMSINLTVNTRGISTTNKSLMAVNEMLAQGWKVEKIVCSNENINGVIGGFVVLEKDEE